MLEQHNISYERLYNLILEVNENHRIRTLNIYFDKKIKDKYERYSKWIKKHKKQYDDEENGRKRTRYLTFKNTYNK